MLDKSIEQKKTMAGFNRKMVKLAEEIKRLRQELEQLRQLHRIRIEIARDSMKSIFQLMFRDVNDSDREEANRVYNNFLSHIRVEGPNP